MITTFDIEVKKIRMEILFVSIRIFILKDILLQRLFKILKTFAFFVQRFQFHLIFVIL